MPPKVPTLPVRLTDGGQVTGQECALIGGVDLGPHVGQRRLEGSIEQQELLLRVGDGSLADGFSGQNAHPHDQVTVLGDELVEGGAKICIGVPLVSR